MDDSKKNGDSKFYYDCHQVIYNLSKLPNRILQNYDVEGLSEIVLHDMSHDSCFNLKKAVYLIDNPDFDHLVGAAGFCSSECKHHKKDLWESPSTFKEDMKCASFHNNVKKFFRDSLKRKDINLEDDRDVELLAKEMGIEVPKIISWNMKHGNHGILIFEKNLQDSKEDLLNHSVGLLGLCGT